MEKTEAIEILDYMFEFLFASAREGFETEIDDKTVKKYLSDAGFASEQIENALDYLQTMATEVENNTSVQTFTKDSNALRIYSKEEQLELGPTAVGVLTYLDNKGSITPAMREAIVEQIISLPYECELEEILWIIESAALNLNNNLSSVLASSSYEDDKEGTRH